MKSNNQSIVDEVSSEWQSYIEKEFQLEDSDQHTDYWIQRQNLNRPSRDGIHADPYVLENFRRIMISVGDNPAPTPRGIAKHILRRGERVMLMECIAAIENSGDIDLLKKYPCHPAGNPRIFNWNGIPVTHRWIKHIHHLGMINRILGSSLGEDFSVLDIGSSYGVFTYMMKREYPESRHVLVDLPNQLLFAHYFLRSCFPDARIAGARTVAELGTITRETVDAYDFVLLPTDNFEQLGGGIDLVTSFSCLGELKRSLFDRYLQSEAFRMARYFYTSNPVDKHMAMQDAEVCVLDYPILDPAKRLYFGISPVFLYSYGAPERKGPFGYKLRPIAPYFESITEI